MIVIFIIILIAIRLLLVHLDFLKLFLLSMEIINRVMNQHPSVACMCLNGAWYDVWYTVSATCSINQSLSRERHQERAHQPDLKLSVHVLLTVTVIR